MKKQLTFLILCLTGALTLLTAGEMIPIDGFEQFPECKLYAVKLPDMRAPVRQGQENDRHLKFFKETLDNIGSLTAIAAIYDKKAKFDTTPDAPEGVTYNMVAWTGFLRVKTAGTYTFLSTLGSLQRSRRLTPTSYGVALFVNGQCTYKATGRESLQDTLNVDLKPGMVNLKVVVYATDQTMLNSAKPLISYKLKEKVGDYREITPAQLYHKNEEEDETPPAANEPNPTFIPIDGFEQFPECKLYAVKLPDMRAPVRQGQENDRHLKFFKETLDNIGSLTAIAAIYDKKVKFDTTPDAPEGVTYNMVAWTGFLRVKTAGTYTFLSTLGSLQRSQRLTPTSYGVALFVNGQCTYKATGRESLQETLDVDLKPGMVNLKVVVYATDQTMLNSAKPLISYKLKEKVGDYREITPAILYHKTEEEDW